MALLLGAYGSNIRPNGRRADFVPHFQRLDLNKEAPSEQAQEARAVKISGITQIAVQKVHPRAAKEKARESDDSRAFALAEWTGLEPATPGVTGRYSNQLNYHS